MAQFLNIRLCALAALPLFAFSASPAQTISESAQGSAAAVQAPAPTAETGGADSFQERIFRIYETNKDAVVKVYAQKDFPERDKNGKEIVRTTLDVGSGFLISKDGHVMTSAYITHGAKKIWIEWKGILLDAQSVGLDPLTTAAVVKIQGDFKSKNASFIPTDSAGELPKVGSILTSISYEMGLPAAPRFGLATGHNIEFGGNFLPTVYVRTNIAAVRGSTGGPVFDISGKFVGMIIAALPEIGGSFILPARAAARIRDDIILCGEPVYSWFGLRAEDADSINRTKVVVTLVAENAPAKKAGFMVGDEILEINSKDVINNTELRNSTFYVRPGETAVFKVRRGAEIIKLEVLAERMAPEIIRAAEANLTPRRMPLTSELPRREAPDAKLSARETAAQK